MPQFFNEREDESRAAGRAKRGLWPLLRREKAAPKPAEWGVGGCHK